MSESHPRKLEEQHSLWLFRDFVDDEQEEIFDAIRRQGRVERWGHDAVIPVFAGGDDVVVVLDGSVVVRREATDDTVLLSPGDAFGKTPRGRVTDAVDPGPTLTHDLGAIRETTISTISRGQLRDILEDRARRRAAIGRWLRKTEVEVPLWPLLGAMPTTRLARLLVHLVENYGKIDGARGRLPAALRASQLAQLAGLDKSEASRGWELFEKAGLVSHNSGVVVLEDVATLRQYALG